MTAAKAPHPFLYTLLIVPFGAVGGFVTAGLGHLGNKAGVSIEEVATLTAVGMLPHTWKFVWAPVADTTLGRRSWYLLSLLLCALGTFAMGAVPLASANLHLLQGVIFVTNLATTTLGMAVEGTMAHLTPTEERGRVGGWFQAGNLGGAGLGGGLGLTMLVQLPAPWMAGAVLALLFLACGAVLLRLPDVPRDHSDEGPVAAMVDAVLDLWHMVKTRAGLLAGILCFLPLSTGAAAGVLAQAEVAAQWGATEVEVAWTNGVLSGLVSALGCLVGGEICARMSPKLAYAAFGGLMAAVAGAMSLAPMTPASFVGWGLFYSFCVGLAYAAFTGFVLEVIGSTAAATKYNSFAALSNTPITYMGLVLAAAAERWGAAGMLWTEAGAGLLGLVLLGLAASVLRGGRAPA